MWLKRTSAALLATLLVTACGDRQPTRPDALAPPDAALDRGHGKGEEKQREKAVQRARLLTEIPILAEKDGETVHAFLSITELGVEESGGARQLTADGVVGYVDEDGQYLAETFSDVPITLSRIPVVATPVSVVRLPSAGVSLQQQPGPAEPGVCDILFLTLGPLNLDLLGLVVDLSNVELDLDAVPGAGNLLGNLLCAVTGLLDVVGALAQILQLLDAVNDILGGLGAVLSGLDVIGSVLGGGAATSGFLAPVAGSLALARLENGQFEGELTVTDIDWDDDAGTFLVDGVLSGKARVDGKMRQIRGVGFEDVPARLDDEPGSLLAAGAVPGGVGILQQQAPNEDNVCDVLFLDLAPLSLALLGLTVDLSEVVLDVDAVPGAGNLVGNLLCAVTGLLDGVAPGGGLGGLLGGLLQGLLDAVGQLLGGLLG